MRLENASFDFRDTEVLTDVVVSSDGVEINYMDGGRFLCLSLTNEQLDGIVLARQSMLTAKQFIQIKGAK